jgi:hypothetical protein
MRPLRINTTIAAAILLLRPATIWAADAVTNPPPPLQPGEQKVAVPLLSYQELGLSLAVLLFGVFVVIIQYRLLSQIKSTADETLRTLTVSLIVVVSLVLVSSGYGKDQITPVLGLFGTIVGYLLGAGTKQASEK